MKRAAAFLFLAILAASSAGGAPPASPAMSAPPGHGNTAKRQTWLQLAILTGGAPSAAGAPAATPALNISLAHGSNAEKQTRRQLERLLATYNLAPWIQTHAVVIDEQAIPHSHPVLTLHTRHLKDDDLLLSTFVHEQMHWLLTSREAATEAAIAELARLYPKTPVGFPQGSADERGNYVHLLVIWLEYRADRQLLGELRARQVMEFWATDHYTWIYRTVLDHRDRIGRIVSRHKLLP